MFKPRPPAPDWAAVLPKEASDGGLSGARRITFVRHGQSEANRDRIWQGSGSSPLTEEGRAQAERAGGRLARQEFDIVQSSDLERCRDTAALAGFFPEVEERWREGDLGEWEGLSMQEVHEEHGKYLRRLHSGENLPLGYTGETAAEVAERGESAIKSLLGRLEEGGRALVFTHGGLITGVVRRLLGMSSEGSNLAVPHNTALCQMAFPAERAVLATYNDAFHLTALTPWAEWAMRAGAVLELVRHGLTAANLERRVQGQSDWGLHEEGRRQAAALGRLIGPVDFLYTSPLERARDTARIVFDRMAAQPLDELMEINMGEWEGEYWADLAAAGRLDGHRAGRDLPRGGSGETWAELQRRAVKTINGLAVEHSGSRTAVVSHGGTIRAYAAWVLGFGYGELGRLGPLGNTSVSQVTAAGGRAVLVSYNAAGHLEG